MERVYWLQRKRSHAASARTAATSEIRLIHLDLAGRYSVKAAAAPGGRARCSVRAQASSPPWSGKAPVDAPGEAINYEQLEIGARWLASRAGDPAERQVHLGMANRYARLRLEPTYRERR